MLLSCCDALPAYSLFFRADSWTMGELFLTAARAESPAAFALAAKLKANSSWTCLAAWLRLDANNRPEVEFLLDGIKCC